jgi:hypothetical protein
MIIQSDDALSIPVGYLQLKNEEGKKLDATSIGILALIFQFKGMYRTTLEELAISFDIEQLEVIANIEYLKKCGLINFSFIRDTLVLTHGEKYTDIHENAYSKRASFARKMKGSV